MHEFLVWLGWSIDNTFWPHQIAQSFWHSPLGLFCTLALTITSAIRVLHHKANAGIFDTFWHLCMSLICCAGFFVGLQGAAPHHLVKTLVVLMTIRGIYKCVRLIKYGSDKTGGDNPQSNKG